MRDVILGLTPFVITSLTSIVIPGLTSIVIPGLTGDLVRDDADWFAGGCPIRSGMTEGKWGMTW